MKRACLGLPGEPCGEATDRRRCPICTSRWEAARPSRLGRYKWNRLKAIAIRRQPWCSVCRAPDTEGNPLEPDHRVPLSRGGKNVMSNLDVLCRFHNRQKGNRLIEVVRG